MMDRQEWVDLPGQIVVSEVDDRIFDVTAFRAVHTLGSYKVGAIVPISRALLENAAYLPAVEEHIAANLDRFIRPWAYPDRMRWPHWEPFPRWQRLRAALRMRTP